MMDVVRWHDKIGGDIAGKLPPQYKDFAEVFSREAAEKLPELSDEHMEIILEQGAKPPVGRLFPLSQEELDVLREYIDEMMKTGKIRPSKSPFAAPCFFVPKPHGRGLRFVVDYRGLNAITVKDKYPLPLMTELFERLSKAKVFTNMDCKNGFNLV